MHHFVKTKKIINTKVEAGKNPPETDQAKKQSEAPT